MRAFFSRKIRLCKDELDAGRQAELVGQMIAQRVDAIVIAQSNRETPVDLITKETIK